MVEVKSVLLVMLYWLSGQPEADTKIAFRWSDSVEGCQALIGQMEKGMKEKFGSSLMTRATCLSENELEALNPNSPDNQKLVP